MQKKNTAIMAAAMDSVAEKGLQGSTTAEISKKAGVGEGTLYRYFRDKDELLEHTAFYANDIISDYLQKHHDNTAPIQEQYESVCGAFLRGGLINPTPHIFLERFRNSPQGINFKRQRLLEVGQGKGKRPFLHPLPAILQRAMAEKVVKEYPFQLLASLTIGPLVFVLKDSIEGLLELNEQFIQDIARAGWHSICR